MTLTPEQKQAVSGWVSSGDNLSTIQKKLSESFQISMTYMDVRFLVDDLNLQLKDAAPKPEADLKKVAAAAPAAPEKKGLLDKAKEKLGLGGKGDRAAAREAFSAQPDEDDELSPLPAAGHEDEEFADEDLPAEGGGNVSVTVDKVTLIPGAVASGTVTFSDGVTGKWIVDNYGRPGFTEISKKDYRPSQADAQSFMQELSAALQQRGF